MLVGIDNGERERAEVRKMLEKVAKEKRKQKERRKRRRKKTKEPTVSMALRLSNKGFLSLISF